METREAYPPPPAAVSRLKGGVTGLRAILRNIAFIFASFLATWVVSLLYWLVVPRIIGPTGWGEYNLGLAIAGIAFTGSESEHSQSRVRHCAHFAHDDGRILGSKGTQGDDAFRRSFGRDRHARRAVVFPNVCDHQEFR